MAVGTSGFDYPHWRRGVFYPREVKAEDRLAYYAEHFRTVELNGTFYRLPSAQAFRQWAAIADAAPQPFVFAVKASRYLTHIKRLREPREPVELLMERAMLLGRHLGPVLLQLPPSMKIELERLEETIEAFGRAAVVVEPRHESWFVPELEALLRSRGVPLCLADRKGPITPIWRTADWIYVRFHQGRALRPCYPEDALRSWRSRLVEAWGANPAGFAFFNNDALGCAVRDAETFGRLLAEPSETTAGRPTP